MLAPRYRTLFKSTLSPYNHNFVQNFSLLQKSRDNIKLDTTLHRSLDSMDYNIDDIDPETINSDTDD